VLLISAFVCDSRACAGRLLSRRFSIYVTQSAVLAGGGLRPSSACSKLGITNLPSWPLGVVDRLQFACFLLRLVIQPVPPGLQQLLAEQTADTLLQASAGDDRGHLIGVYVPRAASGVVEREVLVRPA